MKIADKKRGREIFYRIVDENKYLNLATSDLAGNPWLSNIFYGFDKETVTFCWGSPKESKHSRNIAENTKVAINIYNPATFKEIDDPIYRDAVYIEATAKECRLSELKEVLPVYAKFLWDKGFIKDKVEFKSFGRSLADYLKGSPLRFYVAKVERAWLLGAGGLYKGKFVDGRVEVL